MSYSGDGYGRMDREFRSFAEEIAVDEMHSNFWCKIRFESDREFIRDCRNKKYSKTSISEHLLFEHFSRSTAPPPPNHFLQ